MDELIRQLNALRRVNNPFQHRSIPTNEELEVISTAYGANELKQRQPVEVVRAINSVLGNESNVHEQWINASRNINRLFYQAQHDFYHGRDRDEPHLEPSNTKLRLMIAIRESWSEMQQLKSVLQDIFYTSELLREITKRYHKRHRDGSDEYGLTVHSIPCSENLYCRERLQYWVLRWVGHMLYAYFNSFSEMVSVQVQLIQEFTRDNGEWDDLHSLEEALQTFQSRMQQLAERLQIFASFDVEGKLQVLRGTETMRS